MYFLALGASLALSLPLPPSTEAPTAGDEARATARAAAMAETRRGIEAMIASYGGEDEIRARLEDFRAEVTEAMNAQSGNGQRTFRVGNNDFGKSITASAIKAEWTNSYPASSGLVVAREAIIDFDRKLKALGIDLIVIPRPAKIEVYAREFESPLPDGIPISVPRLKEMLALLDADVEVVEVLPTLLDAMTTDDEIPLYETTGHHISGLGVRLVGEQVAEQLARYELAGRDPGRFSDAKRMAGERITPSVPMWAWEVLDRGEPYAHVPRSEVVVIGDSNAFAYRTASWASHIAHFTGVPVTDLSTSSGAPTAAVRLASQGLAMLKKRKVVVWIISCTHMERRGWPIAEINEEPSFEGILISGDVDAAVQLYHDYAGDKSELRLDEDNMNGLGYDLLGEGKVDQAIAVFQIVTDAFPHSANAFDSLGEAYVRAGTRDEAIECFKTALGLNPSDLTRDNSLRLLAQLGVEYEPPGAHELSRAAMEAIAGEYDIDDGKKAFVRIEEAGMTIEVVGQPKVELGPVSDTVFSTAVGFTIEFTLDSDGRAKQVAIAGRGMRYEGVRAQ